MDDSVTAVASTGNLIAENAEEAERFLRAMANRNRLMVLCSLVPGELSVSALLDRVPLSQSALSQHLAVLRNQGLVETRREAQTIHYRISDPRVCRLMPLLCEVLTRETN
ncbi:ArsR/SmtB family transcription factor [Halofilum ochraceum]|uniref:ArsR/SmtB family transcription factor n=1 Tax=Halofilum ochraceum TaxID=1611323 RepID=UPI0008DA48CB|nr:metalloregulator ArsR/SmtB family transcription factor [Halofilum ochraceum]